jgi:hypothetical protein
LLLLYKHFETQQTFSTESLLQMYSLSQHAHRLKTSSALLTDVCGPYPDGPLAQAGHRASSSVPETRVSSHAGDCSAGTSSAAFLCSLENFKFTTEAP